MIRVKRTREAHGLADRIADSVATGTTLAPAEVREAVSLSPHGNDRYVIDNVMRWNRALDAIGVTSYRAGVREGKIAWFSVADRSLQLTDVATVHATLASLGLELADLNRDIADIQKKVNAFKARRTADERRRTRLEYLGTLIERSWLMDQLATIEKAILTGTVIDDVRKPAGPMLSDGDSAMPGSMEADIRALRELYVRVSDRSATDDESVTITSVSRDAKERIASAVNIENIEQDVDVVISAAALTHAVRRHGKDGTAKNRRPFTADDVDLLPIVLNHPTSIEQGKDTKGQNAPRALVQRRMTDTLTVVVEVNATERRRSRGVKDVIRINTVYWVDKKK